MVLKETLAGYIGIYYIVYENLIGENSEISWSDKAYELKFNN